MTLNELKTAVPGFQWQSTGIRFIGTPNGEHIDDAEIAVTVSSDGKTARVGGYMRPRAEVEKVHGPAGEYVRELLLSAAESAEDEARAWRDTADMLRAAVADEGAT